MIIDVKNALPAVSSASRAQKRSAEGPAEGDGKRRKSSFQ
jgi:hypothetical protein